MVNDELGAALGDGIPDWPPVVHLQAMFCFMLPYGEPYGRKTDTSSKATSSGAGRGREATSTRTPSGDDPGYLERSVGVGLSVLSSG